MSIKNGILLLLLFTGTCVFAQDAIIQKNYSSKSRSAIESSNYKMKSVYIDNRYNEEMAAPAVKELIRRIAYEPDNYALNAILADVYLKSKQYEQALENLAFLYNLNKNNKLEDDALAILNKMFPAYKRVVHKDGGLLLNMAVLSLLSDGENAIDYAVAGAERSNNTEMIKKTLEIVFDSNQDPVKAMNVCDKILQRNPNDVEVSKIKAVYLIQLNQKKEAIEEYTKVAALSPEDDDTRYNLYQLLTAHKKTDDKEILRRLYGVVNSYDQEAAYVKLANLLLSHDDVSEAKIYATKLMKKYDQNPNGYIIMSEIYKSEGKHKEAYDTLNLARDKADDNQTAAKYNVMLAKLSDEPVKEANNLIASGLYEQALELLDSANPEALYVILTQARTHYLMGNKQKTFDYLNKAMSLYKDNSDVYCAFGYIYLQEKDTETARKYANESLKLDKNNKTAKDLMDLINKSDSSQYTTQILDAMEAQNYEEAMRLVNEAMAIDKKSADLYYYKSLIYIAMNNYAASTSTLYKCIELNRNYTDAYFYLGAAFDNLGEKDNALTNYKRYIDMTRGNEIGATERIEYAKARIERLESLSY